MRTLSYAIRIVALLAILGATSAKLCSQAVTAQASGELSLQQYISELDKSSAALSEKDPVAIHSFRAALPSEWMVNSGGQSTHVKTDWLSVALAIKEKNPNENDRQVQQATQRLAALRQSAQDSTTPPADMARSRVQMDRILSGSEFRGARGPSWLDQLKARIFSWITRHLQKLFSHLGVSTSIGNMIAWTVIALAALLVSFWAVRYMLGTGSREQIDLHGTTPAGQDRRYWAREAHARAERGDYRGAIHAAYWAAIARMEEANLLHEDRSRTPRESLKLVQKENAAYAPLANLTRRFEVVWYGYRVATANDWSDAKQQLETLECLRSSTPAIAAS